jgi:hypothetical protein
MVVPAVRHAVVGHGLTPHLRPWLDQLAEDVAARAVLQDITTLAGQVDTLTEGQMRARPIGCLARVDQICRYGAAGSAIHPRRAG